MKNYNEKCDMWSMGVLIYFMLSGSFPFDGKTHSELMNKTMTASFTPMEGYPWENITSLAKDFIKKLLVKDPKKRLSPKQALKHPWFEKIYSQIVKIPKSFYENIRNYQKASLFKKEALNVLAKFINDNELFEYDQIFQQIDVEHNGYISCE